MTVGYAASPNVDLITQQTCSMVTKTSCEEQQNETTSCSEQEIFATKRRQDCVVSFRGFAKVHEVLSIRDYSEKEFRAVWYNDKEYEKFADHCKITVERIEKGKALKDKKYCAIGLEYWTDAGMRKRQRNRGQAFSVVLEEQLAQWEDGENDQESISELYSACTASSRMVATTTGLRTEREVKEHLDEYLEEYLTSTCEDSESLKSLSYHSRRSKHSRVSTQSSKSSKLRKARQKRAKKRAAGTDLKSKTMEKEDSLHQRKLRGFNAS
jgi:hypothetical protein